MIQKLEGLKTTLWSGLLISLTVISILHFQAYLLPNINFIEKILYGVLVIGFILSAQFSCSRFTLLILLFSLYFLIEQGVLSGQNWLDAHQKWLYLSSVFILGYLTILKDRGIFSIHGLIRVVGVTSCIGFAKLWLVSIEWLELFSLRTDIVFIKNIHTNIDFYTTYFPFIFVALFIFYKSIRTPNLLVSALLTTLILANVVYVEQVILPPSFIFFLLTVHYITVVVIDSYYLAFRDDLTTLPSRRALNQYALSLGRRYCVAMLDIDHFKKFNDNYGHDIGDQVLKLVAAKLSEIKSGGRVFRYGGEEFTAIFPRKSAEEAKEELENLRRSIADYNITIRHPIRKTKKERKPTSRNNTKNVSVTISIGVATRNVKDSFEHTLKEADKALYRAKKKGRNQVCF